MKKIALVLSGSGHQDGTEITEAVSLIIALSKLKTEISFFAPDLNIHPQNHLSHKLQEQETRNVLLESARITRGKIQKLEELTVKNFDGVAFPGGYGAALHLSSWGQHGANCEVHPLVAKIITEFHEQSKPIAAICIAPVLIAKTLGKLGVTLTIGNAEKVIQEIRKTGAQHEICPVQDFITDRDFKVITTPAYMYDDALPHEVFEGISQLAQEFVEMA